MSEHALQVAVAHMLQLVLDPERTWWSAIDHGVGKLGKRAAGMMKARGVKPGLPDFVILVPGPEGSIPLGIELKINKGKLSPAQVELHEAWTRMGVRIFVARSLEEVQEILEFCRVPMRRRMTIFGAAHDHPGRAARPRYPRAKRRRKPKDPVPLVLANATEKI